MGQDAPGRASGASGLQVLLRNRSWRSPGTEAFGPVVEVRLLGDFHQV